MKACMVLCIVIAGIFAQSTTTGPGLDSFAVACHDTNQVKMLISNWGKFGQTSGGMPGCVWPKGTTQNYIFGDGFWFGTIEQGTGDTLVSIGYGPHGGESEFGPGLKGWDTQHPCAVIYINPENWPPPAETFPMAPKSLVSHEDSWCCYNDCDSLWHMPGDGRPIGLEVYQTGYEWMRTEVQDIFFMTYEFKNVSGHALNNCYIGVVTDNDIGNESGTNANDVFAGILERDYTIGGEVYHADNIAYQWQEQAESGWNPPIPGVIGFDLLQTPFDLVSGADKDNDGIPDQYERDSAYYAQNVPPSQWDADQDYVPDWRDASENPQKGMTALKRFTLSMEPNTDPERYLTLAGYNINGQYQPYDTVPCAPDDQRFLMGSGPLTIPANSVQTFVFAVMFANWHDIYGSPDTAVVLVDQSAQRYYDMSWFHYTSVEEHATASPLLTRFSIRPNPVTNQGTILFSLAHRTMVDIKLFDVSGRLVREVLHGSMAAGVHDLKMDTRNEPSGTYFLVMEAGGRSVSRQLVIVR